MQPTPVNPDIVCQQAIQAKLNVYQAKEHFESVLKSYNDQIDNLVGLVNLMKNRILELEERPGKTAPGGSAESVERKTVGK
jgi:hypothetical protein